MTETESSAAPAFDFHGFCETDLLLDDCLGSHQEFCSATASNCGNTAVTISSSGGTLSLSSSARKDCESPLLRAHENQLNPAVPSSSVDSPIPCCSPDKQVSSRLSNGICAEARKPVAFRRNVLLIDSRTLQRMRLSSEYVKGPLGSSAMFPTVSDRRPWYWPQPNEPLEFYLGRAEVLLKNFQHKMPSVEEIEKFRNSDFYGNQQQIEDSPDFNEREFSNRTCESSPVARPTSMASEPALRSTSASNAKSPRARCLSACTGRESGKRRLAKRSSVSERFGKSPVPQASSFQHVAKKPSRAKSTACETSFESTDGRSPVVNLRERRNVPPMAYSLLLKRGLCIDSSSQSTSRSLSQFLHNRVALTAPDRVSASPSVIVEDDELSWQNEKAVVNGSVQKGADVLSVEQQSSSQSDRIKSPVAQEDAVLNEQTSSNGALRRPQREAKRNWKQRLEQQKVFGDECAEPSPRSLAGIGRRLASLDGAPKPQLPAAEAEQQLIIRSASSRSVDADRGALPDKVLRMPPKVDLRNANTLKNWLVEKYLRYATTKGHPCDRERLVAVLSEFHGSSSGMRYESQAAPALMNGSTDKEQPIDVFGSSAFLEATNATSFKHPFDLVCDRLKKSKRKGAGDISPVKFLRIPTDLGNSASAAYGQALEEVVLGVANSSTSAASALIDQPCSLASFIKQEPVDLDEDEAAIYAESLANCQSADEVFRSEGRPWWNDVSTSAGNSDGFAVPLLCSQDTNFVLQTLCVSENESPGAISPQDDVADEQEAEEEVSPEETPEEAGILSAEDEFVTQHGASSPEATRLTVLANCKAASSFSSKLSANEKLGNFCVGCGVKPSSSADELRNCTFAPTLNFCEFCSVPFTQWLNEPGHYTKTIKCCLGDKALVADAEREMREAERRRTVGGEAGVISAGDNVDAAMAMELYEAGNQCALEPRRELANGFATAKTEPPDDDNDSVLTSQNNLTRTPQLDESFDGVQQTSFRASGAAHFSSPSEVAHRTHAIENPLPTASHCDGEDADSRMPLQEESSGSENRAVQMRTGPRMKNVCRSAQVAMGLPRATFPLATSASTSFRAFHLSALPDNERCQIMLEEMSRKDDETPVITGDHGKRYKGKGKEKSAKSDHSPVVVGRTAKQSSANKRKRTESFGSVNGSSMKDKTPNGFAKNYETHQKYASSRRRSFTGSGGFSPDDQNQLDTNSITAHRPDRLNGATSFDSPLVGESDACYTVDAQQAIAGDCAVREAAASTEALLV